MASSSLNLYRDDGPSEQENLYVVVVAVPCAGATVQCGGHSIVAFCVLHVFTVLPVFRVREGESVAPSLGSAFGAAGEHFVPFAFPAAAVFVVPRCLAMITFAKVHAHGMGWRTLRLPSPALLETADDGCVGVGVCVRVGMLLLLLLLLLLLPQ